MLEAKDEIEQALALLETASTKTADPPATVVLPPDSGRFIIGNQGGLIRLAIASLQAAKGEKQSFNRQSWVVVDDLDWAILVTGLVTGTHWLWHLIAH